jgi:putative (di)nucleoside polyphosphate hydrolase
MFSRIVGRKEWSMIDEHGYRPNVAIVLCNETDKVFWARRCGGSNGWQFPQGGMHEHETPEQAMFRELREEIGLLPDHVCVVGRTRDWLRYDIPDTFRRRNHGAVEFRGQKQIWFLLRLVGGCDGHVQLDLTHKPEFDDWRWEEYWRTIDEIVDFKRDVYRRALAELEPLLKAPCP